MKIIDSNVTIDYQSNQNDNKKSQKSVNESKMRMKMLLRCEDFREQCLEIRDNLNNLV